MALKKEIVKKQKAIAKKKAEINRVVGNDEFWNKFDPEVKVRIYNLIMKKDCAGLQKEFNTTAENMDRIQNAGGTGSRNLRLLEFLEKEMKKLDYY